MKFNHIIRTLLTLYFVIFSISAFSQSSTAEDSLITAKIKSKIAVNKSLSIFSINVTTHNGVVKLDGEVNSNTDVGEVIEIAQATDGVTDIDVSHLTVKESNSPLLDTIITAKIKGLYLKNKLFNSNISAMTVKVETNNGIVHLSGTADDQGQIDNAIKLAKTIKGVKEVHSRIKIK